MLASIWNNRRRKERQRLNTLVWLACIGLISGCAVLNDPNQPSTYGDKGTRIILTQADRRAVFTFEDDIGGRVCPEPSPDVRVDTDATVESLLEASASVPESISATGRAEFDATRSLITQALVTRSQGLQMLRDLLFQACLANLRGDIPGPAYLDFVTVTLPKLTATLITTELLSRTSPDGSISPEAINMLVQYQILASARP
jgi:hypothetical protein